MNAILNAAHDLDPSLLFRFLEVLNCAYRAGHIQITDYISFLITLLSRYQVSSVLPKCCILLSSESGSLDVEICVKSNSELFRSFTRAVCSCLHQIGDDHLVFKMLEGAVVDQISNKPPLDNTCALLRMITTLDSNPTKLCEQSILKLGSVLTGYMIDVVSSLGKKDCGLSNDIHTSRSRYYILPCFRLFYRSEKILNHVLNVMSSFILGNDFPTFDGQNGHVVMIDHLNRITAVVGILLLMNEDAKVWQMLQCYKKETDSILQNILTVMSDGDNLRIEEKHRVQCSYDRLKRLCTL
ncbi:putative testis-expressed protein 10/pre-rRNA-processing protein Ipi1 [Helianthus annuus]|nr:putative testis-expressed protein 10/pre-rRNA-processing protein Ipi1 [Helianthus annuus]KAJ0564872.1 putative testis-expressed protein 10/pre-rRNA-processing protein Ipi1 [Helianthus annuus]KAJ0571949.1 putative testis-expressed protein 10/pre-rRNA-processing protein Ipi1 [Helianthus annuus]KAJ0739363.1 putative testis-expressed protein 10/pre-rRNA-processing protein Ipi1 [Helianthus annuus]KAJ0910022.1 putative testis-expressed protein 10/pre-rRNA-processing protein Ipi1 [Helianthus annuus